MASEPRYGDRVNSKREPLRCVVEVLSCALCCVCCGVMELLYRCHGGACRG